MDGIRAVEELRKIDPLVAVVMSTGYGTLLTAQQAMVVGANQYLRKPDVAASRRRQCASRSRTPGCGGVRRSWRRTRWTSLT